MERDEDGFTERDLSAIYTIGRSIEPGSHDKMAPRGSACLAVRSSRLAEHRPVPVVRYRCRPGQSTIRRRSRGHKHFSFGVVGIKTLITQMVYDNLKQTTPEAQVE